MKMTEDCKKMISDKAYDVLEQSPMFQLSLASKELFHSNFLAWIGSLREKRNTPDHPFKKLMQELGARNVDKWPETWYVAREYKNFDLCVLSHMPEEFQDDDSEQRGDDHEDNEKDEKIRILLVLENKVKSIPYIAQLHEYQDKIIEQNFDILKARKVLNYKWQISEKGVSEQNEKAKKKGNKPQDDFAENNRKARETMKECVDHLLLTMSMSFPDKGVIEDEGVWSIVSYDKYGNSLRKLDNCFKADSVGNKVLNDYIDQLDALINLHSIWCPEDENSFNNYCFLDKGDVKLKKLRILDFFHKQRYAKICVELRSRLNEVFKKYDIELKNRIIVQEGKEECDRKAIANFGYMHGMPLLDIWLGYNDYVYTIQIQGESYEHGIQKMIDRGKTEDKTADNSMCLWNEIWGDGDNGEQSISNRKGWDWMCPFTDPFKLEGKIISSKESLVYFPNRIEEKCIFADKSVYPTVPRKRNNKYYPYLKYEMKDGLTFIYQYRKISSEAIIKDVIDYIVADFRALCEMILESPGERYL